MIKIILKQKLFFVIFILLLVFASCTHYKDVVYMQDRYKTKDTIPITIQNNNDLKLKYDDNIYVNVYGSNLLPLEMFNKNYMQRYNYSEYSLYIDGYLVNKKGFVSLPLIGDVYVLNKTLAEVKQDIQKKINEYVTGAVVEVRLLTFKITVLGEVRRPGTHSFRKREINIFEVLGMANDILDTGDKTSVLIIRKNDNGITETFELNMTNSEFFGNEGFWLKPNDIVYVKPLKAKMIRLNSTTTSIVLSSITTFFSAITTLILILNYIK